MCIDKLKKGVHVHELLFREGRNFIEGPRIKVFSCCWRNPIEAVRCHPNIFVSINLQEIPPLRIDDKSSCPKSVIILKIRYFLWVAKFLD
mmetsp:Transcript_327/g.554  ORF Transcript_327/g.554 Transcript_327/m.554 type:complete len:90 (+) Transcript_327:1157-1426(+)